MQNDLGVVRFDNRVEIEGAGDEAFSDRGDSGSLIVDRQFRAVAQAVALRVPCCLLAFRRLSIDRRPSRMRAAWAGGDYPLRARSVIMRGSTCNTSREAPR